VPTTANAIGLSEVLCGVGRWWNDALTRGLVDDDVTSIDGWRVIGALRSGEGSTMSEISSALVIAPPTLTRIVDKLVDAGFVLRRVDPMDRRRVLIYLSARGKAKLRKLIRQEAVIKSKLIDEFGEENAVQLVRTLARLADLPAPGDARG
jgi:MarR family transcriptional regulator, organic hydroperoxide resistance regulator